MNRFLASALVVLLAFVTLSAQPDTNVIPKLEEICTVKIGMETPTYLPDFGTKGAITPVRSTATYMLNDPCQLPTGFVWQCPGVKARIFQGDFNGDKNTDYWIPGCGIYIGQGKGREPRTDSIAPHYSANLSEGRQVWDIDNDGIDDMADLKFGSPTDPQGIIFGDKDLWKLDIISMPQTFGRVFEVYTHSDGSARALCSQKYDKMTDFPKRQIITLARLIVERQGEKRIIRLEKLSEFTYTEESGGELSGYSELPGYMYHAKVKDEHTWLGNHNSRYDIFDLRSDTFRLVRSGLPIGESNPRFLHHSIDGDDKEDWTVRFVIAGLPANLYYSGNPADTLLPIGWTKQKRGIASEVAVIGDITGDGVEDFGIALTTNPILNEIVFYKGKRIITGVGEVLPTDKNLSLFPQPVSVSGMCRIISTMGVLQEVEIHTVEGKWLGAIHTEADGYATSFMPSSLGIGAGIYILRAKIGKSIYKTRLIIIE